MRSNSADLQVLRRYVWELGSLVLINRGTPSTVSDLCGRLTYCKRLCGFLVNQGHFFSLPQRSIIKSETYSRDEVRDVIQ